MDRVDADSYMLVAANGGFGKLTLVDKYPRQHRGGMGVKTFKIVDKTGEVTAAKIVSLADEIMLITANGIVERTSVEGISIQGRGTQGVKLMSLDEDDKVVAITAFRS
jgi:DNA gyrase subunit A